MPNDDDPKLEQEPIEGETDQDVAVATMDPEPALETVSVAETPSDQDSQAISQDPWTGGRMGNFNVERHADIRQLSSTIGLLAESGDMDDDTLRGLLAGIVEVNSTLRESLDDITPERLADEIIHVEQALMSEFISQLRESHPEPEYSQMVEQTIISVRSALLGVMVNGYLSGQKLTEIVHKIKFQKTCQGETDDESFDTNKIVAYYKNDGTANTIYIYDNFLPMSLREGAQSHVLTHEIAHCVVESTDLIQPPEVYDNFLRAAYSGDQGKIEEIRQHNQALAEILAVVTKQDFSDADLVIWSGYIQYRLKILSKMAEGSQKGYERVAVARELMAETVSPYLESDGSRYSLLASRMQFCGNGEAVLYHLQKVTGCQTPEELMQFYQDHGIPIGPDDSPEDLLAKAEGIPGTEALFKLNNLLADTLGKAFAHRGDNLHRMVPSYALDIYDGGFDEEEIVSQTVSSSGGTGGGGGLSHVGGAQNGKHVVDKIFDFLFGTGKK
jgi:hypothetical protein